MGDAGADLRTAVAELQVLQPLRRGGGECRSAAHSSYYSSRILSNIVDRGFEGPRLMRIFSRVPYMRAEAACSLRLMEK